MSKESQQKPKIRILVVDDDFRVAQLHGAYVDRLEDFETCGYANTGALALSAAKDLNPDLVLLDLYLPNTDGLTVLRQLRAMEPPRPDVIVISAARDSASVREAMKCGAIHYITKPFDSRSLTERLEAYRLMRAEFDSSVDLDQSQIDRLWSVLRTAPSEETLPKGHSQHTLEVVMTTLKAIDEKITADEIARRSGLSRSTTQRYLAYLARLGKVTLTLKYGASGRPEHLYEWTSS
ncbi:MAG: response regulator [Actinomycetota bacterium]|nr:response regulator [Actinomycetota bacterium]